jgi:hypothetical protein
VVELVMPTGFPSGIAVFNVPELQLSTTIVACASPAAKASAVIKMIFFMIIALF